MEIEEKHGVPVKLHWGKAKLDFVFDKSEDIDTLRAVPPEKQKLMFKGKMIKDTEQIKAIDAQEGATFMLMGAAEGAGMNLEKVETKVFVEDMTPAELAKYVKEKTGELLPFGIDNLGNTCYINSTLQTLVKIPELRKAIEERKNGQFIGDSSSLMKGLALVFDQLENSGQTVTPKSFISIFMKAFPQFNQPAKHGGFEQQDADECFQGILAMVDPALTDQKGNSIIDKLFAFRVRYTWKNSECPDEPEYNTEEILKRLPCIIDNQSNPINQVTEGIQVALQGEVEKRSDTMERNCIYTKIGKLSTLPDYLIVQNIRFIWKEKDITTANEARKVKILRAVNFPRVLDVDQFCVPELQAAHKEIRAKIKVSDEEKVKKVEHEFEEYKKTAGKDEADTAKISKAFKEKRKEAEIKEHEDQLWHDLSVGKPTGNYELIGVITHKGRSSESGHYVGWTHGKGDDWYKFDDEIVTKVKIEDVLALRGGGDWHMAYLLIYRKLVSDL